MQYIQFTTRGRLRLRREFDRFVLQSHVSKDVKLANKQINILLNWVINEIQTRLWEQNHILHLGNYDTWLEIYYPKALFFISDFQFSSKENKFYKMYHEKIVPLAW